MDDETGWVARNWGVAYLSLLSRRYLPYLQLFAAGPLLSSTHFIFSPPCSPPFSHRYNLYNTTEYFLLDFFHSPPLIGRFLARRFILFSTFFSLLLILESINIFKKRLASHLFKFDQQEFCFFFLNYFSIFITFIYYHF